MRNRHSAFSRVGYGISNIIELFDAYEKSDDEQQKETIRKNLDWQVSHLAG
jgi:hypothetical protein